MSQNRKTLEDIIECFGDFIATFCAGFIIGGLVLLMVANLAWKDDWKRVEAEQRAVALRVGDYKINTLGEAYFIQAMPKLENPCR